MSPSKPGLPSRAAAASPSPAHRWFPGYTVAAVSTVGLVATAPGQTFVISQLNLPLSQAFGIEPLTLNTAYMLATVTAALPLVYVGALTDRLGPRRALALIAGLFSLACAAMSLVQGVGTVFLGFFALRFLGQGSLSLVSQHALAMWFHRRLGTMQGLRQVALFVAWIPLPLVAVHGIETIGWRWTYVLFGAVIAVVLVPLALGLLRDRPEDVGLRMDDDGGGEASHSSADGMSSRAPTETAPDWTPGEALRTRAYWTLAGQFFVSPLVGTALIFDMQPMLVARGLEASTAAIPVSVWSAGMAISAIPTGMLADRFPPRVLIPVAAFLIGFGSLVMWGLSAGIVGAIVAVACSAVGQSLGQASGSATVARYFGRAHHGAIRASLARIGVIGAGLGPLATGLSVSLAGDHAPALLGFGVLCLPVVVAAPWLVPPVRRPPDRGTRNGIESEPGERGVRDQRFST